MYLYNGILSIYILSLSEISVISGIQIKMARAALGLSVRGLASQAAVTPNTISRIENGGDARGSTLTRIQSCLERGGVLFLEEEKETELGAGVRLRRHTIESN